MSGEDEVTALARQAGLELSEESREAVAANQRLLAQMADVVRQRLLALGEPDLDFKL